MTADAVLEERDATQRGLWVRTAAVAGRLNRVHGELVDIAAELVEGGHWGDGGFMSPEHYLVVRAGLSPAHAKDVVRVARRRVELPEAARALADGTLSLDQVAVVARHVPRSYQRSMTDFARHATVPQLRRAVSRHAFVEPEHHLDELRPADADDTDERADALADSVAEEQDGTRSRSERRACARPELSMHYDADGRFQLRYSAPATIGALVEQALKEAKDALVVGARTARHAERTAEESAPDDDAHDLADLADVADIGTDHPALGVGRERPNYADAIAEIASRSLSTVQSSSRMRHYRVYLHLSTDGAWVGGSAAIPRCLVEPFLSGGVLQPIWETDGRPVSVGRDLRIVPDRTRRLLEDRDRGCRFPGCTMTRHLEVHHLTDWAKGGRTNYDELVCLCPHHHDGVTRGDYTVRGDPTLPGGLVVTTRYGATIRPPTAAGAAAPPGGDPPDPVGDAAYVPPTGERARWHDIELGPDADLPPRPKLALA